MAQMSLDTAIRLSAEVKGGSNIDRVKKSLQDLAKGSQTTSKEMASLRSATFQFARANDNTIAGIRNSVAAFRGLQEQAKIGSREFQRYGAEIQKLEGKLRGLDGAAGASRTGLSGIGAAAGRLLAAYAGIESVKFIFGSAAELESQTRSLEVLTGSADRAKEIVKELQQLGAVTPFTSTELIDTAKRLQAFGVSAETVVETTRRLADVAGATGAELSGLATAYGQVQAKGRLQGEELLQFQERGVALQQVLREEYGLSAAEFQKALESGKISAEAVEFALKKLTDTGGKYANGAIAQSDTLRGRMSTLTDSVQVLAQTIGKTLDPVFKWALKQATTVVSEIQRLIDEANNTGGSRDREAQFARNADAAVRSMGLNPFTQQGMMADMRQRNIEQQRADYNLSRQAARASTAGPPSVSALPPLAGAAPARAAAGGAAAGGSSSGSGAASKAAAESIGAQIAKSLQQALSLTPAQSAGIVGNLMRESGLNPRVNEGGSVGLPRGVGGYGLAQWTGTRQADLVRFAGGAAAAGNLQTQLRFMVNELLGTESRALTSLRRTTTPEEAAVVFDRDYERSGIKALPERKANARRIFSEIEGTGPGVGLADFAQAANQLNEQVNSSSRLREQSQAQLKILQATDPLMRTIVESEDEALQIAQKYSDLRANALSAEIKENYNLAEKADIEANSLKLGQQLRDQSKDLTSELENAQKAAADRLAYEREYGELLRSGINPEVAKHSLEIDKITKKTRMNLEQRIRILQAIIPTLDAESKNRKELEDHVALLMQQRGELEGMAEIAKRDFRASVDLPQSQIIQNQIDAMKTGLREMVSISSLAINSADMIGSAFGNAFQQLTSGTASAKDVLSGFFRDVAQGFTQMAAQIIAKQMAMIVLQSILKALGAFGGGGISGVGNAAGAGAFGGGGPAFNPGAFSMPALAANGATFANGTAKFAKGGIVSMPTFFRFANGGQMQNGVMGEAGPEAIVPLKRGSDGKLGIAQVSSPQGGENRMRDMMGRSLAQQQAPSLNIKFETTKINGVEYVSREQLELAMAQTRRQAANDGAKRGMNMTLDKMQNSPATRSRVGIR